MPAKAALDKLNILEDEFSQFVLLLALQYSGGRITKKGSASKPSKFKRPVSAGRPRQPIINRHFTLANAGFYPPLTPAYAKRKLKIVGAKPMLVFTGKLKKSIVSRGTITSINAQTALIKWTNVPDYEKFQKVYGRDPVEPTKTDMAMVVRRGVPIFKGIVRKRFQASSVVGGR